MARVFSDHMCTHTHTHTCFILWTHFLPKRTPCPAMDQRVKRTRHRMLLLDIGSNTSPPPAPSFIRLLMYSFFRKHTPITCQDHRSSNMPVRHHLSSIPHPCSCRKSHLGNNSFFSRAISCIPSGNLFEAIIYIQCRHFMHFFEFSLQAVVGPGCLLNRSDKHVC